MNILQIILELLPSAFVGSIFTLILIQSRKIDRLETEIRLSRMELKKRMQVLEAELAKVKGV